MQAIILAAGKGTRFEPLSLTTPKPLFSVMGESILE
ncbi:MAG TPA: sugar phosphate nucleotidyltransferase, partial [Candidatus Pacearchaeota archaeon]|nr:sugar phosphate nucleotidyltransferase [Candidatus Pacearchaeota archaeon]